MRRIIVTLLIAAVAALGIAAPAAAGAGPRASSCPTGPTHNPYNIKYVNGVAAPYVSFKNSNLDTPAISWSSGRLFYWHGIVCTPHGSPMGYWEDYKNQVLSANNACTKWVIKANRSDNGTVTIDVRRTDSNGNHYILLASRFCNPRWKEADTAITKVWASKDIAGKYLVMFNLNHPVSGLYLKVGFPQA